MSESIWWHLENDPTQEELEECEEQLWRWSRAIENQRMAQKAVLEFREREERRDWLFGIALGGILFALTISLMVLIFG